MIEQYKDFLKEKGKNNFWKKAKQKEYTNNALTKIISDLTTNFSELTTRNSITLRYLGLIINHGSDDLEISNAGQTFINSIYKQKILDEQIMKVYLDCPDLNPNLTIKIVPMEVLLHLLYSVNNISFEEYKMFACWINNKDEIPAVISMIEAYRESENKPIYEKILADKSRELQIEDFADNIKRFLDMLLISSYIKNEENVISSPLTKGDIEIIIKSFTSRDFSKNGYFDYLTTNDGWQIYNSNSNYIKIIETLEKKTTEELEEITNEITGGIVFPTLMEIHPQVIDMSIDSEKIEIKTKETKRTTNSPRKIDFEIRDNNNRAVGDFAEKIVIKHESELLSNNFPNFAEKIVQKSLTDDTLGYDVLSFNEDGSEKHIEVKAVKNKPILSFRFYISKNEIEIAKADPNYHLYIVFDYLSKTPLIYKMENPFLSDTPGVTIDPVNYIVTVRIQNNN
jgi:hypothetical protein